MSQILNRIFLVSAIFALAGLSVNGLNFKVTQGRADPVLTFEIEGHVSNSSNYIAIGLSTDNKMGDDAVVACTGDDKNGTVTNYWNINSPYKAVPCKDATAGISSPSVMIKDGIMTCIFNRDITTVVTTPTDPAKNVTIDLAKTAYYVMLASGPTDANGTVQHHTEVDVAEKAEILAP